MLRFIVLFLIFLGGPLFSEEIPFRILFTGDLHSSFEAKPNPMGLGGMARLKTAMDWKEKEAKDKNIPVLRFDAGDCTEGSIYFNLGAGVRSFEMLNRLGYNAVVAGNHDWLTGPYVLDKVLERVQPKFSFLSANLNWRFLPEDNRLKDRIQRYEIFYFTDGKFLKAGQDGFTPKEGQDYFKVGVFGLSTNEPLYSFFFEPVRILNPLSEARKTVLQLKRVENVDVIVLLSHMLDRDDLDIAENVSSVDVVIGGHSHNKVVPNANQEPIVVEKSDGSGKAWLAKSGEFARFLGQLDFVYDGAKNKMLFEKSKYALHQMDATYVEDQEIRGFIHEAKQELTQKYKARNDWGKNIFSDHVADAEIDLVKATNTESYFGNVFVNAILEKTKPLGADFSFNNSEFFSHGLLKGPIHSSDIYNAFPLIYDPLKDASWSIWTFDIDGATVKKAIDLVFMMEKYFDVAGLEIVINPENFPEKVVSIHHNGKEIEDTKIYKVAGSQGIIEALKQVKEELPGVSNFQDTKMEMWSVIREYMTQHSPLKAQDPALRVSGRVRSIQPDLAIFSEDITTKPIVTDSENAIQIDFKVRNLGYGDLRAEELEKAKTDPTEVFVYVDTTPENAVDDIDDPLKPMDQLFEKKYRLWTPTLEDVPSHLKLISKILVPSLGKNEEALFSLKWNVSELLQSQKPYSVFFKIPKVTGVGYVADTESLDPANAPRRLEKVTESIVLNNKARTYIYLR